MIKSLKEFIMCNIFDFDDGDFIMETSENTGMDTEGNLMMRLGDRLALDVDSGDIHMVSGWQDDDE